MDDKTVIEQLAASTKPILGNIGMQVRTVCWLSEGVMTHKFLVTTNSSEQYVVRFYPAVRSNIVNFEPDILKRCRNAGARVPEVVLDSRTGPPCPRSYMVYKYLHGAPLTDEIIQPGSPDVELLARAIVFELKLINSVVMEGYGQPIDGLCAASENWHEFVLSAFKVGTDAIVRGQLLPPSLFSSAQVVRYAEQKLGNARPQLTWLDVGLGNIIIENRTLAGLIDFEGCLSGDPLMMLGYTVAAHGKSYFAQCLIRAWAEIHGEDVQRISDRINLYVLLRIMRVAPYAHIPLPTGAQRTPLLTFFRGLESALLECV